MQIDYQDTQKWPEMQNNDKFVVDLCLFQSGCLAPMWNGTFYMSVPRSSVCHTPSTWVCVCVSLPGEKLFAGENLTVYHLPIFIERDSPWDSISWGLYCPKSVFTGGRKHVWEKGWAAVTNCKGFDAPSRLQSVFSLHCGSEMVEPLAYR